MCLKSNGPTNNTNYAMHNILKINFTLTLPTLAP
jgi:hypothetical protein